MSLHMQAPYQKQGLRIAVVSAAWTASGTSILTDLCWNQQSTQTKSEREESSARLGHPTLQTDSSCASVIQRVPQSIPKKERTKPSFARGLACRDHHEVADTNGPEADGKDSTYGENLYSDIW